MDKALPVKLGAGLAVGLALCGCAPLAAQGLGLAQLQGGVAIANSAFDGEAAVGGRGALGFRSGAFVFGPELGYYGIGGDWHLATAAVFARVGRRPADGWYGIGSLGYQGPGTSSGGQSLFGAGLGAGWSARRAGSGVSAEARYLFSLQDVGGPRFGAVLLTVGWEWRW
jgi:hypothetical protein